MSGVRLVVCAAALLVALVAQVAVFDAFAVNGVVPNLVLLVVVAAAISRGPAFGAVVGFSGGLLLDLAPPADHLAGRWALALVIVAVLSARVSTDARRSPLAMVVTVGAASFVGTSVFALTGFFGSGQALPAGQMLTVIGIGVLYDLVLAPFLAPPLVRAFDRTSPPELAAG